MTVEYCAVLTTTDSRESADKLAKSIVESRLAACVQIVGPITSYYWWEQKVSNDQEWQLWAKTTLAQYAALEAHIIAEHSYDVPEVIQLPITAGNSAYMSWISNEVAAQPGIAGLGERASWVQL